MQSDSHQTIFKLSSFLCAAYYTFVIHITRFLSARERKPGASSDQFCCLLLPVIKSNFFLPCNTCTPTNPNMHKNSDPKEFPKEFVKEFQKRIPKEFPKETIDRILYTKKIFFAHSILNLCLEFKILFELVFYQF